MSHEIYLLLGVLAIVCIFLICLCIERLYDDLYNPAPPPCNTVDWQAIERQSRDVQDKAQAAFKARPRVPHPTPTSSGHAHHHPAAHHRLPSPGRV